MQVSEIWRFPVKSMQGERVREAVLGPNGIEGDRAWALFDVETGAHLTARRSPDLLLASARLTGADPDDGVRITLPDGTETDSDHTLSAWLGRAVRLERAGRGEPARFQTQSDETETGEWYTWEGPTGSFHDSARAPVSLVSEASFGDWDRRRFRLNLVLDGPGDDDLVGHRVVVGGATIEVVKRIDRCVMTTRPQPAVDELPALGRDLEVLRAIVRERDSALGVGGGVAVEGPIAVGDEVAID
jgi:uncharacterized protein